MPLFRLEVLLWLFYLPFLLSPRTRDDSAPFSRSSVLVCNHPRWPRPWERSIQKPIDAMNSFPFPFACLRLLKLSLRPVTIPFACSRPFGLAATSSLSSPFRLCFPFGISNPPRISGTTLRTHIVWGYLLRYSNPLNSSTSPME